MLADAKFSRQEIYAKVDPLNESQALIDKQIVEVKRNIGSVEDSQRLHVEIEKTCESYRLKVKNADFETRKRIVREWVKEINIMDDGSAKVKLRIPGADGVGFNPDSVYNSMNSSMAR